MKYYTNSALFQQGVKHFKNNNFNEAIRCFNILKTSEGYRDKSLDMLFKIDIALGKYSDVRKNLILSDIEEYRKMALLGRVDVEEYNYGRAKELFDNLYREFPSSPVYLLRLSSISANMGYFEDASKYLEKLMRFSDWKESTLLSMVFLLMYQGKYEDAFLLLKKINKKKISRVFLSRYEKAHALILYHLGKDIRSISVTNNNRYTINILNGKREELLTHIKSHMNGEEVRFKSELDVDSLLEKAQELITQVNPSFNYSSNCYKINLDYNIGYNGDKEISGLFIVTLLHTSKIISMYPADFSSEFDREGLSTSQDLRKKLMIK